MRQFFLFVLIFLVSSFTGMTSAGEHFAYGWSSDATRWHSTVQGEFKTGNSRYLSRLNLTMPLLQSEDSLFFFDFRGWIDDDSNDEINAGLAYRKVFDDKIVGVYGFFDRRNSYATGNQFDQVTLGAEILGEELDHRFNVYLPTSMDGQATGFGTNLRLQGNQLFITGLEERAYRGFDYEVGTLIKEFGENEHELRVFGGAYYFNNDAALFDEPIAGGKLRLEMRLFDLAMLGEGSRMTFYGETQWDKVRDTQAYGGLAVQIPIGNWGTGGNGSPLGANSAYRSLTNLERRMYDPILRDDDVVTQTSGEELVSDAEGDPLFVATQGSFGLDDQITNAGANGTVVLNGTLRTAGNHELLNGQRLTSGGTVQGITGATSGRTDRQTLPGRPGRLVSTNPANPLVVMNDNIVVADVAFEGGTYGLFSSRSVSGVSILNNSMTGATIAAIGVNSGNFVTPPNFEGTIQGNTIVDNFEGFFLAGDFSGFLIDNTFDNQFSHHVRIFRNNLGVIRGNTANNSRFSPGIRVFDNFGTITNNVTNHNGLFGIEIAGDNNGVVSNNQAMGNDQFGIRIGGTNRGIISLNKVINNGDGLNIGLNEGQVINNVIAIRGPSFRFGITGVNRTTGVIRGNTITGSGVGTFGFGISLGGNEGQLSNNVITGIGGSGIVFGDNNGVVSGNIVSGNVSTGIAITTNNGRITSNTVSGNGTGGGVFTDGFLINTNAATGIIADNVSFNNAGAGYNITTNNNVPGTINNTGSGNGSNNTAP